MVEISKMIEVGIRLNNGVLPEKAMFGLFESPDLMVENPECLILDGNTVSLTLYPLVEGKEQAGNTISGVFRYFPERQKMLAGVFTQLPVTDGKGCEFGSLTETWATSSMQYEKKQ